MPAAAVVNREALQLHESISLAVEEGATTIFDEDGCVPIHIIRPGIGKGRGRHLYEAAVLKRDAHKFTDWRMFVDHQSPEARRAAGGLPRSVRDLGGRIVEAWWDPAVPANPAKGHGPGAVVGRAKPVPFVRDLIENDPGLIEASISAQATGVHPVKHSSGQRVWAVEGFQDRGSVDWVTEAGAGGRVAPLLEASYSSEEAVEMALIESMSDDELRDYIAEVRPTLTVTAAPEGGKETITESEEDKMANLTPEALQEALSAHPEVLIEALQGTDVLESYIDGRVATAISEEKAANDAERDAVINRRLELRDLADTAKSLISESKLPEGVWQDGLHARFALTEGRTPTPELDVVAELDADGAVTKTAAERLTEAVTAAIESEREKLREVAPTRVRGQGPTTLKEGEEPKPTDKGTGEQPLWRTMLSEANVDPDKAFAPAA